MQLSKADLLEICTNLGRLRTITGRATTPQKAGQNTGIFALVRVRAADRQGWLTFRSFQDRRAGEMGIDSRPHFPPKAVSCQKARSVSMSKFSRRPKQIPLRVVSSLASIVALVGAFFAMPESVRSAPSGVPATP